jgi:TatD DNase family protein
MIVDCHCHLDHPDFDHDRDQVVSNARTAGVKAIITHGINPSTNRKALMLAKRYDIVRCALGIYPPDQLKREIEEYGVNLENPDFDAEIDFIRSNRLNLAAIGEIGLDYVGEPDKELQMDVFCRQVRLAEELDLPIVVHTRKAELESVEALEEMGYKKVVLHCFSGKLRLAILAIFTPAVHCLL